MARRRDGNKKSGSARLSLVAALSAIAGSLAPAVARADDQGAPVCPSGYAWDPAAGRCAAQEGGYPTPSQQTTQKTYVPQSVAMSGPQVIKHWREGDPVPDGYRIAERPRTGLAIGGGVLFGAMYFLSVLGAAIVHDANNEFGGKDNADALFIPGLGPFLQMSKTSSATGNVFNAIDGVAQCGGIAMFILGLTSQRSVLVRNDLAKPLVLPMPYVAQGGGGFGLVGRF